MKKIRSSIKRADIKSFVLGLALAIVISFGVLGVLAQSGDERNTYKFMGQEGGLVDRIGSLTVGQGSDDSWILDSANRCLTQSGSSGEVQSCLSVRGEGAFSKLTVLDMPAFIQNSSLFLSSNSDQGILVGLPTGLVIDDFSGSEDSIMISTLQYEIDGNLAPRNLDEQRNLCADPSTGILTVCDLTYDWEVGTWGECVAGARTRTVVCKDSSGQTVADSLCTGEKPATEETCTSSYSCTGTTPAHSGLCPEDDQNLTGDLSKLLVDSCSGDRKCEYECVNGYHKEGSSCVEDAQVKIDWNGSPFNWVEGTYYGNVSSPNCGYKYQVDTTSGVWQRRWTIDYRGNCLFRTTSSWENMSAPIYE